MQPEEKSAAAQKEAEINFHFDRAREGALRLLKSVLNNPRLTETEQLDLLLRLAEGHRAISDFIFKSLGIDPQNIRLE